MGFTLYDPNMNEIQFPVGVKPLDLFVSSIEKERKEQQIDGIPGVVDYGFNYKQRDASMTFWLRHFHGEHDYFLMKSEIDAMFDNHAYIYASHNALPSRVIKLTVDGSFEPERIAGSMYANLEVEARVTGQPFWQTRYTTQELQNDGFNAIAEKYGLADGIHQDFDTYTHTTNTFTIWNGGNVKIDPRFLYLKMTVTGLTTNGNFTIENVTTGEKFIYKDSLSNKDLTVDGTKVLVGISNKLRSTNRKFPSLNKGKNTFKVINGSFKEIKIDTKYYYK